MPSGGHGVPLVHDAAGPPVGKDVMRASPTENTSWAYGYFRVVKGALLA